MNATEVPDSLFAALLAFEKCVRLEDEPEPDERKPESMDALLDRGIATFALATQKGTDGKLSAEQIATSNALARRLLAEMALLFEDEDIQPRGQQWNNN